MTLSSQGEEDWNPHAPFRPKEKSPKEKENGTHMPPLVPIGPKEKRMEPTCPKGKESQGEGVQGEGEWNPHAPFGLKEKGNGTHIPLSF
ncbi:hypothetical protein AMTR_s00029p00160450 [Amborella trichopoda]|uniref:Uncharacterized protein n=1 Tax=Amborella trichopoda TaxID=13333 RepID=W1PPB7_AMBTC|nr:hypothetical protein AMTR_s00029p00160450 [Amborella trichopoda]